MLTTVHTAYFAQLYGSVAEVSLSVLRAQDAAPLLIQDLVRVRAEVRVRVRASGRVRVRRGLLVPASHSRP
eukprot:scaffold2459_cov72-Phaeocystis_antarctica.AAC.11